MQKYFLALTLAYAFSSNAFAARSVRSIPLNLFSTHDFSFDRHGVKNDPSTSVYGSPARVGAKIEVLLNLVNMSNVPQTGTVSFLSAAGTSARAICQTAGVYNNLSGYLYLCLPGSTASVGALISSTSSAVSSTQIPAPVRFTVAPNDATRVIVAFVAFGTYGVAAGSCEESAYFDFIASIEIMVNEDRGALAASLTPRVGPIINYTTTTQQYCGVGPAYSNTYYGKFDALPITPIFINGGRPF